MAGDIIETKVNFHSDGDRIVGDLFMPAGEPPAGGFPAIVCLHGYGGLRKTTQPETARAYARDGFAAIIIDYRGFGESGGTRGRLHPLRQVEDVTNAITFLTADKRVDASRIGIHGSSFGGALAIATSARDARVRAVVCSIGVGNGRRWLKSLRRNWEWLEFEREMAEDRINRVLTGESRRVNPYHIMVPDPASSARHVELNTRMPERVFTMPLECAEAIVNFSPEDDAANGHVRPGLIITVVDDTIVPDSESYSIYDKWPGPKRLITIPDVAHHDVFNTALPKVMQETIPWFRQHLDVA